MPKDIRSLDAVKEVITVFEDSENIIRKDDAFEDYRVYAGDQKALLDEKLKAEFPDSFDEMRPIEFNFCKKIVNKRARIYRDGINRMWLVEKNGEFVKDEEQQAILELVYKDMDIDNHMKKANAFYELFHYVLLQTYLDGDGHLQARVLAPYLFDVMPDLFGNMEVVALSHYVENGTMKLTSDALTDETKIWTLWSDEYHTVVREEKVKLDGNVKKQLSIIPMDGNDQRENPLKELPFIMIKSSTDGFYYPMRHGLSQQCLTLNLMLSDVASIARIQGFGQATLVAHENVMPENVKVGIKSLIKIPIPAGEASTARFEFVNSNAPIAEQMGAIEEYVGFLLSTNDLSAEEVSGKTDGINPVSGISRLIESSKLLDSIETTKSLFIKAENDLWDNIQKWLNLLADKNQLPERYKGYKKQEYELRLDFLEVKPIQGEEDRLNMIERKIELGLMFGWQKHQILNPDLTDEEAQQMEEDIKLEKQENLKANQEMFKPETSEKDTLPEQEEEEDAKDE